MKEEKPYALIFLNGIIHEENVFPSKDRTVICVDGGARHTQQLDIIPDIILGDFDSLPSGTKEYYKGKDIEWISHPPEKDQYETDSELALRVAQERGCTQCDIYGFSGDRLDHMIANLMLCVRFSHMMSIHIHTETQTLSYVTSTYSWEGTIGDTISLIPLTPEVTNIHTSGFQYPLSGEILKLGSTRGISNVMNEKKASIRIQHGCLVVIRAQNKSMR